MSIFYIVNIFEGLKETCLKNKRMYDNNVLWNREYQLKDFLKIENKNSGVTNTITNEKFTRVAQQQIWAGTGRRKIG